MSMCLCMSVCFYVCLWLLCAMLVSCGLLEMRTTTSELSWFPGWLLEGQGRTGVWRGAELLASTWLFKLMLALYPISSSSILRAGASAGGAAAGCFPKTVLRYLSQAVLYSMPQRPWEFSVVSCSSLGNSDVFLCRWKSCL